MSWRVHPTNQNILLIGAVNGGVWRTTNATSSNPTWSPSTDFISSLSIGALSFDRSNANVVYAGGWTIQLAGGDRRRS